MARERRYKRPRLEAFSERERPKFEPLTERGRALERELRREWGFDEDEDNDDFECRHCREGLHDRDAGGEEVVPAWSAPAERRERRRGQRAAGSGAVWLLLGAVIVVLLVVLGVFR